MLQKHPQAGNQNTGTNLKVYSTVEVEPDPTIAEHIPGGYRKVPILAMLKVWHGSKHRMDIRVFLALNEMVERRRLDGEKQRELGKRFPRGADPFRAQEIAKFMGERVTAKRVHQSLRRLEADKIIEWGEKQVKFLNLETDSAFVQKKYLSLPSNRRGSVKVPRQMLRYLARHGTKGDVAVAIGVCIRCMFSFDRETHARGRVSRGFVKELFVIADGPAKRARRKLIGLGWLVELEQSGSVKGTREKGRPVINKYGPETGIRLDWRAPKSKGYGYQNDAIKDTAVLTSYQGGDGYQKGPAMGGAVLPSEGGHPGAQIEKEPEGVPKRPGPGTKKARPCLKRKPSLGDENPTPRKPVKMGFENRTDFEEKKPENKSQVPTSNSVQPNKPKQAQQPILPKEINSEKSHFHNQSVGNITRADLADFGRLRRLYREFVSKKLISESKADQIKFYAAAEHCLEKADVPGALFQSIFQGRTPARVITDGEEETANRRRKQNEMEQAGTEHRRGMKTLKETLDPLIFGGTTAQLEEDNPPEFSEDARTIAKFHERRPDVALRPKFEPMLGDAAFSKAYKELQRAGLIPECKVQLKPREALAGA